MIKIKKNKRINPEKSNRLIWAVAGGLLLVFIFFGMMLTYKPTPANQHEKIASAMDYLKSVNGITKVDISTAPDRVLIVYDSNVQGKFVEVARYAARRLADEIVAGELALARNRADNVVLRIVIAKGAVAGEKQY